MTPSSWNLLSISDLAPRLKRRELSAETLTDLCLEQIQVSNADLNAFITVLGDQARAEARALDEEIAAGRYRGPLHGIPISLKDLIDIGGVPTTAASRIRAGHVATSDAPVVTRLRDAGAVLVGKCNLHEFAFGTTNEESAYGPARHPLDPSRSPGGSSGGSAIAVATGMCVASIGTDTGGSIRIPAAACGTVGLKASYGELTCDGIVPLSRSLDHVGPLARTVGDARLLFHVMRGDSGSSASRLPMSAPREAMTLGIPRAYFFDLLDDEVRGRFDEAIERLRRSGVTIKDVEIHHAPDIAPIYLHVALPEASAFHSAMLETRPQDYTPGVRLRIEMGRYILAEDHVRAQRGRDVLRRAVNEALTDCDALALPTLPIPAPPIGASTIAIGGRIEPVRNVMLRLTQLFNLTGHPAVSLPCGRTSEGLPCGFQLVGALGRTDDLLGVALACEAQISG